MSNICPECGSTRYRKHGFTVVGRELKQRWLCKNCLRSFTYFGRSGSKKKYVSNHPSNGSTVVIDASDADE